MDDSVGGQYEQRVGLRWRGLDARAAVSRFSFVHRRSKECELDDARLESESLHAWLGTFLRESRRRDTPNRDVAIVSRRGGEAVVGGET